MTLRIHNTLSRGLQALTPIEPGHVRMYVCGITIYDLCHIGHARMMIAFDVIARWLRASGLRVTYVRNVTDIDDKIIRRAVERGISLRALTDEMIHAMHADLDALGIERPTHEPRATEYVPQMLAMIGTLEDKGLAYRSRHGDVNFAVRKDPGYGKLSGKSIDELRAGERVAVPDGKDDPLDFALWKAAKPGEPEDAKYPSPYGPGRPGWHIECSAMCKAVLGAQFDLHGGGADLQFPHHENEIAQSEGANGVAPAVVWAHNGLLNVDHVKMSKSLGNFFTIREVLERYDGETIRFFMLRNHYRSPVNFSDVTLDDARNSLRRLYTSLEAAGPVEAATPDWQQPRAAAFREAMDDDFNTPGAVAVLFELAGELNRTGVAATAVLLKSLGATLGVLQQPPQRHLRAGNRVDEARIGDLIAERTAAKAARDFARADAIRQTLVDEGIALQDSPQGNHLGESLMAARPAAATGATAPVIEAVKTASPGAPPVKPTYWDEACKHLGKRDRVMRKLIPQFGSGCLQSRGDAFTTLARSIVGQQISVKAAQSVWNKFAALLGEPSSLIEPAAVLRLAAPQMRAVGLSARKVEYLSDLAQHFASGAVHVGQWQQMDDELIIEELVAIRGIGRWTAEMFLIFHLMRPNVLPLDDVGLLKGISVNYFSGEPVSRAEAREVGDAWAPYRSVATWYIWRSLDPLPVDY